MTDLDFNIKGNLDIETSKAENKIKGIADKSNGLGVAGLSQELPGIAASSSMEQPLVQSNEQLILQNQQTQIEGTRLLNSEVSSLADCFSGLTEVMPSFVNQLREAAGGLSKLTPIPSLSDKHKKEKEDRNSLVEAMKSLGVASLAAGGIAAGYEWQTSRIRKQQASLNADVFGMKMEDISGIANVGTALTSILPLLGGAIGSVIPGLGTVAGSFLGGAGKSVIDAIINGASGKKIAGLDLDEAKSQLYQSKLPSLEKSLVWFDFPASDAGTNRLKMERLNSIWTEKARDTGVTTDEFAEYVNSLSTYGLSSKERAGNIAHNAAIAARFTGVDINTALDFMGSRARLGSVDTERDMNRAYSAAMNSGLHAGQFGEFLDGLQSAVEQGIQKGYVASTDDISRQMVMFSKLSGGNDTWEGKYGFQKLSTINAGLSGATSLSSSSQKAAYQALRGIVSENVKGGAYIEGMDALNTLSLMESGLRPESFTAISRTLDNAYGNDTMSKVAAWKEISGLNWTGAMQLAQMNPSDMSEEELSDVIETMKADKNFQTDSVEIKNLVNQIKDSVFKMSSDGIDVYIKGLSELSEQKSIASETKGYAYQLEDADFATFASNHFEPEDPKKKKIFNQATAALYADYNTNSRIASAAENTRQAFEQGYSYVMNTGENMTNEQISRIEKALERFLKELSGTTININRID